MKSLPGGGEGGSQGLGGYEVEHIFLIFGRPPIETVGEQSWVIMANLPPNVIHELAHVNQNLLNSSDVHRKS